MDPCKCTESDSQLIEYILFYIWDFLCLHTQKWGDMIAKFLSFWQRNFDPFKQDKIK